jgi:hypothetical protein
MRPKRLATASRTIPLILPKIALSRVRLRNGECYSNLGRITFKGFNTDEELPSWLSEGDTQEPAHAVDASSAAECPTDPFRPSRAAAECPQL